MLRPSILTRFFGHPIMVVLCLLVNLAFAYQLWLSVEFINVFNMMVVAFVLIGVLQSSQSRAEYMQWVEERGAKAGAAWTIAIPLATGCVILMALTAVWDMTG